MSNLRPLVSVIIPVYNGDRYIAQAIESVLAQTYTHYEIIIVDDGSSDRSRQVLQPYLPQIRYIYQANQGVAAARNRGIQDAQGEFIAFLDQDDYFLNDKLAAQVNHLTQFPCLGVVHSGWQVVNHQREVISHVELWQNLPNLTLADWVLWKPVLLGAMLFRKQWLIRSGGFDSQFHQTPDVDLMLRLALMGCQIGWVKQATLCYRQHDDNTSHNVSAQAQEMEALLDRFFCQPDLPPEICRLDHQSRYQSLVWSASRAYHIGNITLMIQYLKKSLTYTSLLWTETICNWIDLLKIYTTEYGIKLDIYALTSVKEWKQLVEFTITRL